MLTGSIIERILCVVLEDPGLSQDKMNLCTCICAWETFGRSPLTMPAGVARKMPPTTEKMPERIRLLPLGESFTYDSHFDAVLQQAIAKHLIDVMAFDDGYLAFPRKHAQRHCELPLCKSPKAQGMPLQLPENSAELRQSAGSLHSDDCPRDTHMGGSAPLDLFLSLTGLFPQRMLICPKAVQYAQYRNAYNQNAEKPDIVFAELFSRSLSYPNQLS